jgi:hypothetical protein
VRVDCPECERPLELSEAERVACVCGFSFLAAAAEAGAFRGRIALRPQASAAPPLVEEAKSKVGRVFTVRDRVPLHPSRAAGVALGMSVIFGSLTFWFGFVPGVVGVAVAAAMVFPRATRRERLIVGEGELTLIAPDGQESSRVRIADLGSIQAVQTDSTHWCVLLRNRWAGGESLLVGHPLSLDEGTARWLAQRLRGLLGGHS